MMVIVTPVYIDILKSPVSPAWNLTMRNHLPRHPHILRIQLLLPSATVCGPTTANLHNNNIIPLHRACAQITLGRNSIHCDHLDGRRPRAIGRNCISKLRTKHDRLMIFCDRSQRGLNWRQYPVAYGRGNRSQKIGHVQTLATCRGGTPLRAN